MASETITVKLFVPLDGVVHGVVFLNAKREVIGGFPILEGWLPGKGDKLLIEYDPKPRGARGGA